MPWYKVYADHGGGHMGHTEFYHWSEAPLDEQNRAALWEETFSNTSNAIGDAKLIKGLPKDVLLEKRKHNFVRVALAKAAVLQAKEDQKWMANILSSTKELACSHARSKSLKMPEGIFCPPVNQCITCGKIRTYHKDIKGWIALPKDLLRFARKIAYAR